MYFQKCLKHFCNTEGKINKQQTRGKMTTDNFIASIQNLTEFSMTSNEIQNTVYEASSLR